MWIYCALGGRAGVAHPAERGAAERLLTGVWGLWALIASAATRTVGCGRPARLPRRIPLTPGSVGAGSLHARSGWKPLFVPYVAETHPAGTSLPENLAVAAVPHTAAVAAGALMLPAPLRPGGCATAPGTPGANPGRHGRVQDGGCPSSGAGGSARWARSAGRGVVTGHRGAASPSASAAGASVRFIRSRSRP